MTSTNHFRTHPALAGKGIRLGLAVLLTILMLVPTSIARGSELYDAYAPPMRWGPELRIRAHIGACTYTVEVRPDSESTLVLGRVTFFADQSDVKLVTREFVGSISFRTANVVGQPVLQFKGIPTGTKLTVRVD